MKLLVTLTLLSILTLTFFRAVFYQAMIMRQVKGPQKFDLEPGESPVTKLMALLGDPEHRALRRTWAASWVWTTMAFFVFLFWALFSGDWL
jgi:hypothetical protein